MACTCIGKAYLFFMLCFCFKYGNISLLLLTHSKYNVSNTYNFLPVLWKPFITSMLHPDSISCWEKPIFPSNDDTRTYKTVSLR